MWVIHGYPIIYRGSIHPWVVSPDLGTHQPENLPFHGPHPQFDSLIPSKALGCRCVLRVLEGGFFGTLFESLGIGGERVVSKMMGKNLILESVNIEKNNIMYIDVYVDLRKNLRENCCIITSSL